MRKYVGYYNNGHDSGAFEYYSSHRNYSEKNMEDLKEAYRQKYGYSEYYNVLKYGSFDFGYLV